MLTFCPCHKLQIQKKKKTIQKITIVNSARPHIGFQSVYKLDPACISLR